MKILDNKIDFWYNNFPFYKKSHNKYDRGHVLVIGGEIVIGAACLSAQASLRIGAGVVTIGCLGNSHPIYASSLHSIISKPLKDMLCYRKMLEDKRINVVVIGPGCGVSSFTRELVLESLKYNKICIIDADAITSFENNAKELFDSIKKGNSKVVFTPHLGEFKRLFKYNNDRIVDAYNAAKESNSIVILKGAETVIADFESKDSIVLNQDAPPWLATAGTGDVLAGMISGLASAGMDLYKACCAAVWIHSQSGFVAGYAMVSEDLLLAMKKVLQELLNYPQNKL